MVDPNNTQGYLYEEALPVLTAAYAPHFIYSKCFFMEHRSTARQQAIMQKKTFKHNSRLTFSINQKTNCFCFLEHTHDSLGRSHCCR